MLPSQVIYEIEQIMRSFLWQKNKSKVAWEVVCLPKREGGLGIRRLHDFNVALMAVHIWNLLAHKESLWVKWMHMYKIKNRNFWEIPCRGNLSCSWRKMLQIRPIVRRHFWYRIGSGNTVSAWYDNWCDMSPLSNLVSPRTITNVGFSLSTSVADLIHANSWLWPADWDNFIPAMDVPILYDDQPDVLCWKDNAGLVQPFSVSQVWDAIRPSDGIVNWFHFVWFKQCIPKHAFLVWLVVKKKLKTQDLLQVWEVNAPTSCAFCGNQLDSHDHLFFQCDYPALVWKGICIRVNLDLYSDDWDIVLESFVSIADSKKADDIIAKLVLGASLYFIWQERNFRIFQQKKRTIPQLIEIIYSTVRLKLLSCHFRKTIYMRRLMDTWKLPLSIFKLK